MRKVYVLTCFLTLASFLITIQIISKANDNLKQEIYCNPVIMDFKYHDSSLIKEDDSCYYSFVSCLAPRDKSHSFYYSTVSIFRSKNLVDWEFYKYALPEHYIGKGTVFLNSRDLSLNGEFPLLNYKTSEIDYYNIWAPNIVKFDNFYYLFVSLHKSRSDSKIAVFKSRDIKSDFEYIGLLLSTNAKDGKNNANIEELIDPYPIVDKDSLFMIFGSFRKDINGKSISDRSKMGVYMAKILISGKDVDICNIQFITDYYEGCIIIPHKNKYYLLGSNGYLWNHSYQVSFACSDKLFGPYLNLEGKSIADTINYNPGSSILTTKALDRFNGFGCPSRPIIDKNGQYWVMMHGHAPEFPPIQMQKPEEERYTFLVPLYWDKEGKPYFDVDEIQRNKIRKPVL